jgi:hypothetical protein
MSKYLTTPVHQIDTPWFLVVRPHQEITDMRLTIMVCNGWSYSNMNQSRKHITSNTHCLKRSHAGTKLLKYVYHNLFQHNWIDNIIFFQLKIGQWITKWSLADILWSTSTGRHFWASSTIIYWEQHLQEQNKKTTKENFRDADGMLYLRM